MSENGHELWKELGGSDPYLFLR